MPDRIRYCAAVDLRTAMQTRARIEGDLVMVDEFLNHRVDTALMRTVGTEIAEALRAGAPDTILTAEASGIPPALACASELDVPMVYAKKFLGTGDRYSFSREVVSPTKGAEYRVEVSRRVLEPGTRIAIVDDFLSGGRTAEALGEIAEEAGCEVVGFGFVVEKAYEAGRSRLEAHGWPVTSLVTVKGIENGTALLA
jgi:xanthine phosphoribosyltransferase